MARCAYVRVSIEFWQTILTKGFEEHIECIEGLPEGAELINSAYEDNPPSVYLLFHHPSFKDIPVGGRYPIVDCFFAKKLCQPLPPST